MGSFAFVLGRLSRSLDSKLKENDCLFWFLFEIATVLLMLGIRNIKNAILYFYYQQFKTLDLAILSKRYEQLKWYNYTVIKYFK